MTLPPKKDLTIQFSHPAYRLADRFALRQTGIRHYQTETAEETQTRLGEADVLVCSGFWRDDLLEAAPRLRFIQVCAAGFDQFGLEALKARGVRLANGRGVNANAVSEHALALILALTRQLHTGRDNQRRHFWRGMLSDLTKREDELPGKTVVVYGLGSIGARIALLAKAFGTRVIGIRRNLRADPGAADEVRGPDAFREVLAVADIVVLACPLTPETRNLIDAAALAAMKPGAYVINVARGGCVDEAALIAALRADAIAGAGIDTTEEEPLPADSPLWDFENVVLTPHTAGETRKYEDNVVDVLMENLDRLWRGETELRNQIV